MVIESSSLDHYGQDQEAEQLSVPSRSTHLEENGPEKGIVFQDITEPPPIDSNQETISSQIPRPWKHPIRFMYWCFQGLFGLASLVFILAVLAAIPIVNVLALGYLIAAEGHVARTGKLSQGFPLYQKTKQLGSIVLGTFLFLMPLRYLGGYTAESRIIDPNSGATKTMDALTAIIAMFIFTHLLFALGRGGALSYFFRPIKNIRWMYRQLKSGNYLEQASTSVRDFFRSLELLKHFKLGLFAAFGVLMWTFIPTSLYALADSSEGFPVFLTFVGGFLLLPILSWLPILQAHYTSEEKFSAYRQLKHARTLFRKTPMLWTFALLLGYGLSLVLYLFKVVAPPQDGLWMMTLFFIALIYPVRLLIGWIYARAEKLESQPHFLWRWLWNSASIGVCGLFVFILFFTKNIGANGKLVLFEQPLLMIPSPF